MLAPGGVSTGGSQTMQRAIGPSASRREIYEAYLLSPHWIALRADALNRANRKCEACGGVRRLVGHHLCYRDPLENCTAADIMCLCERCHDLWHDWQKGNVPHGCLGRAETFGALFVLRNTRKAPAAKPRPVAVRPAPATRKPAPTPSEKKTRKILKRTARNELRSGMMADPHFVGLLAMARPAFMDACRKKFFHLSGKEFRQHFCNALILYDHKRLR